MAYRGNSNEELSNIKEMESAHSDENEEDLMD